MAARAWGPLFAEHCRHVKRAAAALVAAWSSHATTTVVVILPTNVPIRVARAGLLLFGGSGSSWSALAARPQAGLAFGKTMWPPPPLVVWTVLDAILSGKPTAWVRHGLSLAS